MTYKSDLTLFKRATTKQLKLNIFRITKFVYGIGSKPNFLLAGEQLGKVDKLSYLGSCMSPSDRTLYEVSMRVEKTQWVFVNLRNIWRRCDIRLSIKGWIYIASVRSALLRCMAVYNKRYATPFDVLAEYDKRLLWITQKLDGRYWVFSHSVWNRHWIRTSWGGWCIFRACLENVCLVICTFWKHEITGR